MNTRNHFLVPLVFLLFCSTHQANAAVHHWSHGFGGAGHESSKSVAVDDLGNSVITGYIDGPVDLGGGPLASGDYDDIFVAKFDPDGNHLWSQGFPGAGSYDQGHGVAVDGSGNVFITGEFRNTIDLGGGPLTSAGDDDIFVAKFDPDGNHLWSQRFGGPYAQQGLSVAVDGPGNVFVAGDFYGSVDFGGGPLTSAHFDDIFVVKFDPNGNHLWSQSFGDVGPQNPDDIAVDSSGNLLISGSFAIEVDFGGGSLMSAGDVDVFVAKFDPDGNHLWSQGFGWENEDEGRGVACDGSGNVLVTGNFHDTVDFGGGPLTSAGGNDIFVAKFDPNGVHLWSQRFGDSFNQGGQSIAVDYLAQVVITGGMHGSADFGGGTLTSAGTNDIFVAQFDTDGAHLGSELFGDSDLQAPWCVAVDGSANILLTGWFLGNLDFGGGPLANGGNQDIFLAKFSELSSSGPGFTIGEYIPLFDNPPYVLVEVKLHNLGPGNAYYVIAELSENISWLRITDPDCFYGDIPEGESSWGEDEDSFTLYLTAGYPGGVIDVQLHVWYEDSFGNPCYSQHDLTIDPNTTGVISGEEIASAFRLLPNYPNPFNPATQISFDLPRGGNTNLVVYNLAGQVVRTLWSGELPAGHHSYVWKGVTDGGRPVPSGIYFSRLRTGKFSQTRQMVLVR